MPHQQSAIIPTSATSATDALIVPSGVTLAPGVVASGTMGPGAVSPGAVGPGGVPVAFETGVWESLSEEEKANIIARGQPVGGALPAAVQWNLQQAGPLDPRMQMALSQQQMGGAALPAGILPGSAIKFEAGDFGKVLKVMNAERMQLEGALREEENEKMKEFAEQKVSNHL